jgi:hypothetical protein
MVFESASHHPGRGMPLDAVSVHTCRARLHVSNLCRNAPDHGKDYVTVMEIERGVKMLKLLSVADMQGASPFIHDPALTRRSAHKPPSPLGSIKVA